MCITFIKILFGKYCHFGSTFKNSRWIYGCIEDGWMDIWMDAFDARIIDKQMEWRDGQDTNATIMVAVIWKHTWWRDGWIPAWMVDMDGWMDGWMMFIFIRHSYTSRESPCPWTVVYLHYKLRTLASSSFMISQCFACIMCNNILDRCLDAIRPQTRSGRPSRVA